MYKAVNYNPSIHYRRSIRLKGYDYSRPGMYFITICCQDRECRFGYIENQTMILNQFGIIARNEWYKLPKRFNNLQLDVFQIMPNHIHAIIILNESPVRATPADAPNDDDPADAPNEQDGAGASPAPIMASISNPTVGDIVGAYKSLVANECLKIFKSKNEKMGKLWQRNYYEHIIRNHQSFKTIANYIMNNPARWNDDKFFMGS